MSHRQGLFLNFDIKAQPHEVTCGSTCLHALYEFYKDPISLKEVVQEVKRLKNGGTLGVMLGNHALKRGYKVHIYTYNLTVFDPTWFELPQSKIIANLKKQMRYKFKSKKRKVASKTYIEFLKAGGKIFQHELDENLIKKYLKGIEDKILRDKLYDYNGSIFK